MASIFDTVMVLDVSFLLTSTILFCYAYAAARYMRKMSFRPKVIYRVMWVGFVGIFAAVLRLFGVLLMQQALIAAHVFGMTLMSTILIFALRDHLQLLKTLNLVQEPGKRTTR